MLAFVGDLAGCERAVRERVDPSDAIEVDSIAPDGSVSVGACDGSATPCDYASAYACGASLAACATSSVVVRSASSFLGGDAHTGLVAGFVDGSRAAARRSGGATGRRPPRAFVVAGPDSSSLPDLLRRPGSYCAVERVGPSQGDAPPSHVQALLADGSFEEAYAEARARAGAARNDVGWPTRRAALTALAASGVL